MKIYGTDTTNPQYAEILDFYFTLLKSGVAKGLDSREARARAFDAIELRFCIKRSRAEQIVYAMLKSKARPNRPISERIANNKELIAILEEMNDAYAKSK